ncbi:phosphatases II, partial [Amniculicola lignicola CBS 123094]
MGLIDPIPRLPTLHIGGLYALYQTPLLLSSSITHVISVLDYTIQLPASPPLSHLLIEVEDDPNVNLLQHFPRTNAFISDALGGNEEEGRRGVFVHCAMGKSRSATIVIAYLMDRFSLSPSVALEWLCEGRPVCDPNWGFKEQLLVWEEMLKERDEEARRVIYERWLSTRFIGEWWEWEER